MNIKNTLKWTFGGAHPTLMSSRMSCILICDPHIAQNNGIILKLKTGSKIFGYRTKDSVKIAPLNWKLMILILNSEKMFKSNSSFGLV